MSAVSIVIRAKNEASSTFDRVKGDIKDFSNDSQKAMSGINSAQDALSKAMRGDLVGAAHSAASAFKSLWAVVMSNPVLLGLAAAAAAIAFLAKNHMNAAAAAREEAQAQKELNDEILRIRHNDPASVKKANADAMVQSGDRTGLEKMVGDYRAKVEEEENNVRVWGFSTEGLQEAQAALDIYSAALDELHKKNIKDADAEMAVIEKDEEEKRKLRDELADAVAEDIAAQTAASRDAWEKDAELRKKLAKEIADTNLEEARRAAQEAEKASAAANANAADKFALATDSDYRKAQEKKARDDAKAAARAQREYENAIEKAGKGIRGRGIDAALAARDAKNAADFAELEALDAKLREQDAKDAYAKAVQDTAKNTADIARHVSSLPTLLLAGRG